MPERMASTVTAVRRTSLHSIAGQASRNLYKSFLWAWLDVVCQYRRSRIGPFWETINVVVMMLGLTVVSSAIFGGKYK